MINKIAVWLDDERPMPADFDVHVKTATEAIQLLSSGSVRKISLDHDLGPVDAGTGYDVALFIEKAAYEGTLAPIQCLLHTANPVGREKMKQAIINANRYWIKY